MSSTTHKSQAKNASSDGQQAIAKDTNTQTPWSKTSSQHQRIDHKADQDEHRKAEIAPQTAGQALSSGPASATAVNSIMGPPPPREEKMSFWKRWKRDRQESRELRKSGMPSHESDRRWKVAQIV